MITLASDFGSPYPAAMKGVILRRCDARLVDVAHDFPRQDVRSAAFWLREVLPEFPPAVHLAVVDPGVGTDRAAVVVRAGDHALVGPDNGLLVPAARRIASRHRSENESGANADDGPAIEVFDYAYDDPASTTFHGRDVFAPAAAAVHEAGVSNLERLDAVTPAEEFVDLSFPSATVSADRAEGEVLAVDGFGNVITNVPGDALSGREVATVRPAEGPSAEDVPVGDSFAAVDPGDRVLTVGSHGYVECDVNRGRGDEAFGLGVGDGVTLAFSA